MDASGNVYVTGGSSGGSTDYATIKYDSDGNQLWVARYDGPSGGTDGAEAIAVDESGNVYVTGYSEGAGISNDYPIISDYATIKYDSDGNQLWVARYDGPGGGIDSARAIAVDESGNVYVTGYSEGAVTSDDYTIYDNYICDYVTIKYDSDGNQLWVARYDGPAAGDDQACDLVLDQSSNVYVTGYSSGESSDDYATIKYNSDGNQLWVARYDSPASDWDQARAIAMDESGAIYVTGDSGDEGSNEHASNVSSDVDYATIKYDSDGNQLWGARYDGPHGGADWATAICVSGAAVYVTGTSKGADWSDYATTKYDSDGNQLWVARYDGPAAGWDSPNAIAVDGAGNAYVTGSSYDNNRDYATIKYNSDGNQVWVARYSGPKNYGDEAYAIAVDELGNVYVTGSNVATVREFFMDTRYYRDYATIKYTPA